MITENDNGNFRAARVLDGKIFSLFCSSYFTYSCYRGNVAVEISGKEEKMNNQDQTSGGTPPETGTQTVTCPNCKSPNPSGALFCKNCGNKLAGVEQHQAASTTQPQPSQETAVPPPPVPPVQPSVGQSFQQPVAYHKKILITNTETIPGEEIVEVLGMVQGNTVKAKHIGKDIVAQFKNIVGGEVSDYTRLFSEAREVAVSRMIEDAARKGADAVINVRFVSSTISQGMSELLAYGTAVKLAKKESNEDE